MEAVIEHNLEPELTGSIPRRIRLPLSVMLLLIVAGLLLGLFILGSGRALWEGAKLSRLARSGQTIPGTIVEIRTETQAPKSDDPQQTAIRYAVDLPVSGAGRHQTGWIVLYAPAALPGAPQLPAQPGSVPTFHLGQAIPMRYTTLLGTTLCQPWGADAGSHILPLFLAGGLVFIVSAFLLRRLLLWAGSRLHLLRAGTATVGTITHKRTEAEDMARYFLRYGYADTKAKGRDREEQVNAEQWHKFHVGQPVTVLFDPEQPGHAALYALIVQK